MPPPRVSPPTPVVEMMPLGVARPNPWVAWSTSPHVQPPSTRTVRVGIDPDAFHRGEVDDQAAIAARQPGTVVRTSAHRERQALGARVVHRADHIGDIRAAGDQGRPLVDHPVDELAGLVIAVIGGRQQLPAKAVDEL